MINYDSSSYIHIIIITIIYIYIEHLHFSTSIYHIGKSLIHGWFESWFVHLRFKSLKALEVDRGDGRQEAEIMRQLRCELLNGLSDWGGWKWLGWLGGRGWEKCWVDWAE